MGFNLGDIAMGAVGGFGSGLAMVAKDDMDAKRQEETDKRRAEIETMRATAMAKLQREMTQPDRDQTQLNFNRTHDQTEKYQKGMLDNKAENSRLQAMADDSRAALRMSQSTKVEAEAEAAKAKANGTAVGAGGADASKPLKLDQTMNDADKIRYAALVKSEEHLKDEIDPKIKEQKQQALNYQKIAGFGDPEMTMTPKGEVIFRNRFGDTQKFKDAATATAAGFGGEKLDGMVNEVNAYLAKQGETTKQQATMRKSGEDERKATERFNASPQASQSLRGAIDGAEKPASLADMAAPTQRAQQPAASPQNLNEAIRARSQAASVLSAEENTIKQQAYDAAMQQMGGAMTDKNVRAADAAARQAVMSNPKTASLRKAFEEADSYVRSMARM